MIVNPDHMTQAGVDATLKLLEARGYSGVISPHGWMDPATGRGCGSSAGSPGRATRTRISTSRSGRRCGRSRPRSRSGGATAPTSAASPSSPGRAALTYPFKSMDDRVTFDRQVTGSRTFDYSKEGVAHYGLYADWFADLRRLGGETLRNDLWDGAEAYLEMWERAVGRASGLRNVRGRALGATLDVGAPPRRPADRARREWTWCVRGGGNDVAVFGRDGRVAFVGSTARGRSARRRAGRAARERLGHAGPRALRVLRAGRARGRGRARSQRAGSDEARAGHAARSAHSCRAPRRRGLPGVRWRRQARSRQTRR